MEKVPLVIKPVSNVVQTSGPTLLDVEHDRHVTNQRCHSHLAARNHPVVKPDVLPHFETQDFLPTTGGLARDPTMSTGLRGQSAAGR